MVKAHNLFNTFASTLMGKRRMHENTIYICDWTGIPLQNNVCYIPVRVNGKLQRKGTFCTWEAALSYAQMYMNEDVTEDIEAICGYQVPHSVTSISYTALKHFGGSLQSEDYIRLCAHHYYAQQQTLDMIHIPCEGNPTVVTLPFSADRAVQDMLPCDSTLLCKPFLLFSYEPIKGKLPKATSLAIFASQNATTKNDVASSIFSSKKDSKVIHGDVLVALYKKITLGIGERRCYITCSLQNFNTLFAKRKRKIETPHYDTALEFEERKCKMFNDFTDYEKNVSDETELPCDIAGGAKMPPRNGALLANVAAIVNAKAAQRRKLTLLEARMRGNNGIPGRNFTPSVAKIRRLL